MGFEPTLGHYPKHAFQACDFNRSSTSPWRDFTARGCLKSDRHSLGRCNFPEKNSLWECSRPAPCCRERRREILKAVTQVRVPWLDSH